MKTQPINEHALIVGGTKGLGKAVVTRFLERGFKVTTLSRNHSPDTMIEAAAAKENNNLQHISVDLERLSSADHLVQPVLANGGPLRYLVFCQRYRGNADSWTGEMQVTLKATDQIIKTFADHFVEEGDKAIGVVSSVYAHFVGGSQPASYHVAKAGLNQLVKFYAWTLAKKDGIRVNAIMPLTYLKPESQAYYLSNDDLMKLYQNFVPLKRIGNVKDSANLIDFLCSERASFINGQSIYVDGGTSIVWPEELAKSLMGVS